ncbi:aminopeptidase [Thermus thermamylovorans]|uniref:Aminopeptidase n=1 Tax=Thermus thermamylovorans TaxID=2509362 RepID=A0A4Q9B1P1_9DEIN|nr:aminopeptidase [Thermus thermamylovorans]TBH17524.1 aminopeptidase [Thermus thermamylovorans]
MEARLAELLAGYCLEAEEGETVLVEAETPALPLLPHLKRTLLQRGAYPLFRLSYPGEARDFLRFAGRWLEEIPEAEVALYQKADKFLRVLSAENPLEAASLDPELTLRHRRAWRPLAELRLKKRWALTLYPTVGYAVGAGMDTEAFRAHLERAFFLDRPDPVGAWQALARFQEALIARLAQGKELRLLAPGTDLRLSVAGRIWINSDGRRNMPSGEVFTGPLEESAEGEVRFNLPAFVGGRRVEGVYLRFRGGEVVEARAEVGEGYLLAALATDPGARRLGEVGIGTNYGLQQPTGLVLLDEKMGGTVHLALGRSYPETGGRNESALHWDLVLSLEEGALLLDGEPLVQGGRFVGLPEPYPFA